MASHPQLDDDDDFGGDFPGSQPTRRSANKRSFGDLDDDEDDLFGSKKANVKVEETAPGVATGMILSLRESLQNCQDTLATCQLELEAAKTEIQKWHFAFQNESFIPAATSPEPKLVVSYLQTLKSSEESLREQLEKAKKKEAAFIVTVAKRELEISELKSAVRDLRAQLKPPSMQARRLLLDPAIHEEFTRLKAISCHAALVGYLSWRVKIFIGHNVVAINFEVEIATRKVNLVEEKDKKVKELQDNVNAVNFTPQSKMGKMLMAKCRTLQEENEEIGNQAKEGKIHELSMKLALQKSQNNELRSQFEGLCKHMEGLTNDVEKSNEMVLIMQERLEEKDAEIERLKQDLHQNNNISEEERTNLPPPDENNNNNNNNKVSDEDHDQQQQQEEDEMMISGEAEAENEKS
ncbi:hypothetical protein LguiA_028086 [Lonicera macranthoides]